jgi:hypothetical protein
MSYPSPQSGWQPGSYEHRTQPYDYGPPAPMPPYGYGYPPPQPAKGNNGVLIAVIVSIAVVAVGIIVYIAPLLFVSQMSSDVDEMISETSGGNTEQILDDEIEVTFGTFTRDTEFTSLTRGKLPVTVRNKGSERATYNIQIEAVDADGNRIGEDTAYIRSLAPGQSVTEEVFTLSDDYYELKGATFKVASVSKY